MHHVLQISEVIGLIFTDLPPSSTLSAACVCRAWSSIALDTLWRDVEFYHLVRLLAPLKGVGDSTKFNHQVSFTRAPEPAEWARFWQCALRVRHLSFSALRNPPDRNIFHAITSKVPPHPHIFPHLHTIEWTSLDCYSGYPALMLSLVPFMHEHVRCLTIHPPAATNLQFLFSEIINRMPHLTYLNARPTGIQEDTEGHMIELYSKLRSLQKVLLPWQLTLRVAEALASLESLQVVEREDEMDSSGIDLTDSDVAGFTLHLREKAFSMLWKLSVEMRLDDMARLLHAKSTWEGLKILSVNSPISEVPETVYAFLEAVSERCCFLQHLTVRCMTLSNMSSDRPSAEHQISFETLRPLLSCPNLVHFEIAHRYPLNIGQEDVETLARSWPRLETLMLNMNPAMTYGSQLTLRALIPFARYCPNLRLLGLLIAASARGMPTLEETTMMRRLTRLHVGMSSIQDAGAVGLFLSRVLPLGCVLKYAARGEMGWVDDGDLYEWGDEWDNELQAEISSQGAAWASVGEFFPMLARLSMAERERLKRLTTYFLGRPKIRGLD